MLLLAALFTVSAAGAREAAWLDAHDVEHRWLRGVHVDWRTGLPDGKAERDPKHATHCSAFTAALAEELKVPLLRPPEHGTHLLASAQAEWLAGPGLSAGWSEVDALAAQQRANQGDFVLAVYRAHPSEAHGHIAVVRPAAVDDAAVARDGPMVTQAGGTNRTSATLAEGFANHPSAWREGREVRFYAHAAALAAPP